MFRKDIANGFWNLLSKISIYVSEILYIATKDTKNFKKYFEAKFQGCFSHAQQVNLKKTILCTYTVCAVYIVTLNSSPCRNLVQLWMHRNIKINPTQPCFAWLGGYIIMQFLHEQFKINVHCQMLTNYKWMPLQLTPSETIKQVGRDDSTALSPSLPQSPSPSLPHSLTLTPSLPHSFTSSLPFSLSPSLPQSPTTSFPHSLTFTPRQPQQSKHTGLFPYWPKILPLINT